MNIAEHYQALEYAMDGNLYRISRRIEDGMVGVVTKEVITITVVKQANGDALDYTRINHQFADRAKKKKRFNTIMHRVFEVLEKMRTQ